MVAISPESLRCVPGSYPPDNRARLSRLTSAIKLVALALTANGLSPHDVEIQVHSHALSVSCDDKGGYDLFGSKPLSEILYRQRTAPFVKSAGMSFEQVEALLQELIGLSR